MTKYDRILQLSQVITEVQLDSLCKRGVMPTSTDYAEALYNAGYRMLDGEENEVLTDAVDATFRGAVLRLAEKLKQCSYCDNCFKDGKWHRYVFIEDIDATVKKFLESET